MKIPDLSIIEKTLNNEATSEESCEVVRWFKTPEGQAWLAERIDQDEKTIHMGEEEAWIDHPIPSAVMYQNIMRQLRRQKIRRFIAYAAAVFIPIALIIGLFIRINSQVDLLADDGYDEVYVPNGERMQVLFQDGSKVHLNSGSRIRYPKKFGLSERKVYLEGEAYFEVEHDGNAPFIVNTRSMDLRVLGTSFNIKAYDDENTVITTLVSGKIRQEFPEVGKDVTLTPSRQSIFDRVTGKLETKQTDVQAALAWKEGKIIANNERLEDIFRQLSRWYDFKVVYTQPSLKDVRFYLHSNRYAEVHTILEYLQTTKGIHFTYAEKTIYVSQ